MSGVNRSFPLNADSVFFQQLVPATVHHSTSELIIKRVYPDSIWITAHMFWETQLIPHQTHSSEHHAQHLTRKWLPRKRFSIELYGRYRYLMYMYLYITLLIWLVHTSKYEIRSERIYKYKPIKMMQPFRKRKGYGISLPWWKSLPPEYQAFRVYNPILIAVYTWKKREERERENENFSATYRKRSPLTSLKTTDHVSFMTH